MNGLVHYTACPVCNSTQINFIVEVKDHTVSGEKFQIFECKNCSLRFTQDVPDENSIGKYYKSENYISHTNTSKGFINNLYQKVRNYTLQQKAKLINNFTKHSGLEILDVGCGTGAFLNVMKEKGWNVTGIEPDEDARKLAAELYNLNIQEPSAFENFEKEKFSAITLWHVLEHVHQLHDYIKQLRTILKKDGKIFIAVPNYSSADAAIYENNWAAYDAPRHLYHFTPKAIENLMQQHGLKIVSKKPMWFDAFYISLLSSKYKNGSTNWLAAPVNGIRSNLKALSDKDYCSSLIYIIEKN